MAAKLESEFFQSFLTRILSEPNLENLPFQLPVILYRDGSFTVLRTNEELAGWIVSYRQALTSRGVKQTVARIVESKRSSAEMSSYTVELTFTDLDGVPILTETSVFYIRETGDASAIEMIEQAGRISPT